MKRVLITGGAGFLGSHLVDRFLSEGFEVLAMDNFLTGSPKNIAHLKTEKRFHFVECDVAQPIEGKIGRGKFDTVMHFACPASPVDFATLPLEILQVDSFGTYNALDVAKDHGARFMIASTSEVYGDPLVHPQTEDYWGNVNPIGPRSCYDEVKRFSEALTMAYHRKHKVNTSIVRIFNTYGPRMRLDDGRVVPNFCGQALRGEPLTVYGDGSQTRSFCYVSDLIDGIYKLSQSKEHLPVNIGNPDEYSIRDFAEIVLKLVPASKSRIEQRPLLHADDPKQRKPVIDRAKNILGWQPKVSLNDGLTRTIEYFRECL